MPAAEIDVDDPTVRVSRKLGPAGLPATIVDRLAAEMAKLMKDAAFLDRLAKLGLDPVPTTPASFAADIRAEHAMWRDLIKSSGVVVD